MQNAPLIAAALAAISLGSAAHAAVVTVNGNAQLIAAPLNTTNSLSTPAAAAPVVRVWNERFDYRLGGALRVDATAPGTYDHSSKLGIWSIDRFTNVSSHFIHLVKTGTTSILQGSVTFDNAIIGVICIGDAPTSGSALDKSDFLSTGTQYPDELASRGIEISATADRFTISTDRRTLSFWLEASDSSDSIRVITSVPTPGSLALLSIAALGASRRRR